MFPPIKDKKRQRDTAEEKEKRYILRHLLRKASVMQAAAGEIARLRFFREYPELDLIWQVADKFYREYGVTVNKEVVQLELSYWLEDNPPEQFGQTVPSMMLLVDELYVDNSFSDKHALEIVSAYKKKSHLQALKEAEGEESDIRKHLTGLADAEALARQTDIPEEVNIFKGVTSVKDILPFLQQTERKPTGVDFIDQALGGGTLNGEVIGIIMPTKTGKTTLSMQMLSEAVMRRQHVVYVQFEQTICGDLAIRQSVLASNSTRRDWKLSPGQEPSQEIQDNLLKAVPLWEEYQHSYDCWVSNERPLYSPSDIFQIVRRLTEQGKKPELVILDWWGLILNKLMTANGVGEDRQRRMQKDWMHEIKTNAKSCEVPVIIFHQVAGAAASKKAIPTAHDAQGDKDWPNLMDACFVSGRKDSESRVTFRLDISRSTGSTGDVRVKLDGERCRFVADSADFGDTLLVEDIDNPKIVGKETGADPWAV